MPPDTPDPYFTPDPSPARRGSQNYDDIINRHAQRTGLDPALIQAVIGQESSGKRTAVSPKGARGLMQLMPATAQRFGVKDVNDPEENIRGGSDYLKFLHDRYKGNTDKVLAAYNAGEGNVDKYGGIPPFKETQNYVPSVKARYQRLTSRPFQDALQQKPESDPYFTPDQDATSPATSRQVQTRKTAPRGKPSAAVGLVPGMSALRQVANPANRRNALEVGGSVGQASPGQQAREGYRGLAEMAGSPTQLLPTEAGDFVNEMIAKGGAGLTRQAAGLVRNVPHDPLAGKNQITDIAANKLNQASGQIAQANQAIDKETNRHGVNVPVIGRVSTEDLQNVGGGAISSAPALILTRLGVPAPVAFGLQSYLESTGRDADWKDVLKETGVGAATGALFEIPVPAKLNLLSKIGAKLGIVGGGTYGIEKLTGMPEAEARKNAAVNALFAASNAGRESPKESIAEPVQTVPEPLQSRVRMGDIRDQAAQQGAELLNPAEVVAGQKPKVRLNANQTEAQPNITAQLESPSRKYVVRDATSEPRTISEPSLESEFANVPEGQSVDVEGPSGTRYRYNRPLDEPVRHVDLQPRRQRGEGKGQFKTETRAQREERLAQVNPSTPESSGGVSVGDNRVAERRITKGQPPDINAERRAQLERERALLPSTPSSQDAVTKDYNQAASTNRGVEFSEHHKPVRFGTVNAVERRLNPTIAPEFRTGSSGDFIGIKKGGQYLVYPRIGATLNAVGLHAGGAGSAFDLPDIPSVASPFYEKAYDLKGGVVSEYQIARPAIFTEDNGKWSLVSKGEIRINGSDRSASSVNPRAAEIDRELASLTPSRPERRVAERRVPPQPETKVEPTERIQPSGTQSGLLPRATPTTTEARPSSVDRASGNREASGGVLEGQTTSARKAQLAQDRAELDLPELPQAERKSWQTSLANAKPERATLLADEVLNKPRSLNDEETASLVVRAQQIKNEHTQTMKEIGESSNPDVIASKKAQADALENEFDRITRATKASGTEKGRTLAAQKLTINRDYDLVSLVQRAKAAKGRDLTPSERARYEQMASQIEDLNKQLSEANEKAQQAQLQKSIDRVKRQTRRQETKSVLDGEFAALKSQLAQAKLETRSGVQPSLLAGLDPEGKLTPIIARMAKNRVKAGINSAEGLVEEVFNAVKDHYDVSRDDIARIVRGTLHEPDDVLSKWDKRRQSQLLKQQSEIEGRLAGRDFSPKPSREAPIYNRETFKLQKKVNDLKSQYDRELYRATRGVTGKLIDTAAGFGNIPKTMLSMADVSAVLRQGGIGVYQHPILSGRAGIDMLKSFTQHGFANVENAIKSSLRFDQAKRAGVEFTGVDKDNPQLSKHEEGYLGSGAIDVLAKGRVNPLRLVKGVKDFSERTFVSFLDSQRMRIFENQAKALEDMGLKGKDLDAALKSQAKYINIITGRGSLGVKGNQAAPALNVALFSPRLIASRFQFLNKMANPVAWANMPKGARKLQMIDNAKFLFGVASTLALAKAAGANVSLDPDDSEFLKIKVGNTRYDTLAGLQQPMRFMYRMSRAVKGGETYEGADKGKIVGDFARSKAAPLAGYAADYLEGKNRLSGKKFEAGKDLIRNVVPLPFQDFQEAIKEDGTVRGIAEAFPTLFGVGTQTYPTAAEKPTTKAEKLARKFIGQSMPDEGRTQEQIDLDQKKSDLRSQARRGVDVTANLKALEGLVTDKQAKSILGSRGVTRLQEDVKRLPLYDPTNHRDVLTVYSTMSPSEQESVKKIVGEKAATVDLLPLDRQQEVKDRLIKLGFKPGLNIPRPPQRPERPDRPNQRAWSSP